MLFASQMADVLFEIDPGHGKQYLAALRRAMEHGLIGLDQEYFGNHYFAGVGHGNLLIARGGLTRSIVGAIGGSGQLGHSVTLPNIGAFATLTLHYQALFQSTTGGLYLGPAQVVNVLGAGF